MHRLMAPRFALSAFAALALCACGSSGSGGTASSAPQHATNPASSRPGCNSLCQNAGPPAGTDAPGCPNNDSDKCLPCPPRGCFLILSRTAMVRAGIIRVSVRCVGPRTCDGAFQIYKPPMEPGPKLAASSFSVPSQASQTIEVAVTPLGRRLAASDGGVRTDAWVWLEGSGLDRLGHPKGTFPPIVRFLLRD